MEYREDNAWKWWCGQPQASVYCSYCSLLFYQLLHLYVFSSVVYDLPPLTSLLHFLIIYLSCFSNTSFSPFLCKTLPSSLLSTYHPSPFPPKLFFILPVLSSNIRIPSSLCYISPPPRPLTLYFPFLLFLYHHHLYIIIVIPLRSLSSLVHLGAHEEEGRWQCSKFFSLVQTDGTEK